MRLFRRAAQVTASASHGALTGVRAETGEALCSTANSTSLDPLEGGFYKTWDVREAVAERIALCWTACRDLSNDELREGIAAQDRP